MCPPFLLVVFNISINIFQPRGEDTTCSGTWASASRFQYNDRQLLVILLGDGGRIQYGREVIQRRDASVESPINIA